MAVPGDPYSGEWTPAKLRKEVVAALKAKFGDQVDASGNVAVKVRSSSARVDADVVPCFVYRHYFSPGVFEEGARIHFKDGSSTENYPEQHLREGRSKNTDTNGFYKKSVRILKRTANAMESNRYHRAVASYFVESLVYNCHDSLFSPSTWTDTIREIVGHIWENTQGDSEPSSARWTEADGITYLFHDAQGWSRKDAHGITYLFHDAQGWSRKDARGFAYAAWNYLELAP